MNTNMYIVEAPELKPGQYISSGGVRENGKMVSQYKNPIPYKSLHSELDIIPHSTISPAGNGRSKELLHNVLFDLLETTWIEYGLPLISAKLKLLSQKAVQQLSRNSPDSNHRVIIDTQYEILSE